MDNEGVRTAESTRRWLASRAVLWGSAANKGKEEELIATLAAFCESVQKSPDGMIDECLRRSTEGGPFVLRTRARREYIGLIGKFEEETGSRDTANVIRSFFIHNGVAMNPSVLIR
jgi:hypothetical protein